MDRIDGSAGATPLLLYVDDDVALCTLVTRGLERRGYRVVAINDGAGALVAAQGQRFDLIAIDHYMPEQDGLETLQQLRANDGDLPPVVYVTGSDESRIAVAAIKAGATDYVVKTASDDFIDLMDSALMQALREVRLRQERDAAEAALRDANERLEAVVARQSAMLREVNHRVANSLQLVSSLVHLQAAATQEAGARSALLDTENRIIAVMQIHRRLYTSDNVSVVDMADYLDGLTSELAASLPSTQAGRRVLLQSHQVQLNTDKAVAVGVIVAELVTNACKYAYPPGAPGDIRVVFRREHAGRLQLLVEDDGPGLSAHGMPVGTGVGRRVIEAMARSLGGEVAYDPTHAGARAVLVFMG